LREASSITTRAKFVLSRPSGTPSSLFAQWIIGFATPLNSTSFTTGINPVGSLPQMGFQNSFSQLPSPTGINPVGSLPQMGFQNSFSQLPSPTGINLVGSHPQMGFQNSFSQLPYHRDKPGGIATPKNYPLVFARGLGWRASLKHWIRRWRCLQRDLRLTECDSEQRTDKKASTCFCIAIICCHLTLLASHFHRHSMPSLFRS